MRKVGRRRIVISEIETPQLHICCPRNSFSQQSVSCGRKPAPRPQTPHVGFIVRWTWAREIPTRQRARISPGATEETIKSVFLDLAERLEMNEPPTCQERKYFLRMHLESFLVVKLARPDNHPEIFMCGESLLEIMVNLFPVIPII